MSHDENQLSSKRIRVDPNLTLDCVVGQPDAVAALRDLVRRVKWPEIYSLWGVNKPKAIALVGPPGVGKTHSIRALANEIDCPLMELKYEDLASHLYDESIKRLSQFKNQVEQIAREHGHVLILIDEADTFFQSRFDSNTHSVDEKKTNFFLRWIDGDLEGSDGFTIIAASNAWDNVDPAVRRAGRFARIDFKALSPVDILQAIKIHVQLAEKKTGRTLFDLTNLDSLLYKVEGITGADVKEIVDSLLLAKANRHLDLVLSGTLENDKMYEYFELITVDDIEKVVSDYRSKQKTIRKGLGF